MKYLYIVLCFGLYNFCFSQNVGINTDGSDPSMMLDVKTSPSALSDGIRINNPNGGEGDAILNFQNAGTDVWTIGFDDSDADVFIIANGGALSTNNRFNIETNGKIGINMVTPNTRLHVNGAAGEDVFRLQANGSTKMLMESDGKISMGGFFSPDDQLDIRGNVQVDQGYLRIGAPSAVASRKYSVQEIEWNGLVNIENTSTIQTIGTFTIPSGIPVGTTIRIDKIIWEVDAFHEDGNETKMVEMRVGTSAFYGWTESVQDGAVSIDWHYVQDFGTGGYSFTTNQTVQMRIADGCCFGDRFKVYNMHAKIYYSYSVGLQQGDISASGRVYSNSNSTMGDIAEYLNLMILKLV